MSLGTMLNVAIGLILTYLLLAIVVSGIQEWIAGWFGRRANSLRDTLKSLLSGVDANGTPDESLFQKVFGHGLIEDMSNKKLPSYIPSRNFALALIDTLTAGSKIETFSAIENAVSNVVPAGPARESLIALVKHAQGDLDVLRHGIENWFHDRMDRLSGEYKRRSQLYLLLIGVVVAVVLNVDSVAMVRALSRDPEAQKTMVVIAQNQVALPENPTPKQLEDAARQALTVLESLPVPIGWRDTDPGFNPKRSAWELFVATFESPKPKDGSAPKGWSGEGLWAVVGWLLSGVAATLGAPFWFALLQQALSLRSTGPKPAPPPAA
jgi:hypothetical protein